jgi:hypothetical protein
LPDFFSAASCSLSHPWNQPGPATTVQATFEQMHSLCLEHFREEEAEAMPLMRRHFTPKEIEKNVVSKILRERAGQGRRGYQHTCLAVQTYPFVQPAAAAVACTLPQTCKYGPLSTSSCFFVPSTALAATGLSCLLASCRPSSASPPCRRCMLVAGGMGPDDVGAYFRTMSKEEFRGFAKQEGIPFFICWILGYQVRRRMHGTALRFEGAQQEPLVFTPTKGACAHPGAQVPQQRVDAL